MKIYIVITVVLFNVNGTFALASDAGNLLYDGKENNATICRNELFSRLSDDYQLGEINHNAPFIDSAKEMNNNSCPSEDITLCRTTHTIKAKTSVVVSRKFQHFYCVYNPHSHASGWVLDNNIDILSAAATDASDWSGQWVFGEDHIVNIRHEGGGFHVTGEAVLYAGTPRTGALDFTGFASQHKLLSPLKEGESCRAELINLGRYMVIRDNVECGGVNVTFNGVYKRK